MKNRKKVVNLAVGAIVAALYVVLTYLASAFGLASYAIQVRFSEALTILPFFTPAAIPGLFVGCLLANILTGCTTWDIVFGSIATLLGALGTYFLRKTKFAYILPPIIANTLIVPPVLMYVYALPGTYIYFTLTVCIGEIISCGLLGGILKKSLEKSDIFSKYN